MEEDEYKATYNEIAAIRCVFEKALTNNQCECSLSNRFWLADREGYSCNSGKDAAICADILEKLRNNACFVLKLQRTDEPLPHNMEIRIQTGGMRGLQKVLYPEQESQIVKDITDVIHQAIIKYNNLDALPYSKIVKSVAEFKVRKRSKH